MRIGIFGGTFDPPHEGHRKYACEAIRRLSLDRLIVIPTFTPPHKAFDGVSADDRLAMTRLLFKDEERITVSDTELVRKGKSYTCETVAQLRKEYPDDELIFLVGSDMLLSFHTWRKPEEILRCVKICAVSRDSSADEASMRKYIDEHFYEDRDRFIICSFTPIEISSTQVRNAVRNGEPTDGMISEQIRKYIIEKELYL